MAPYSQISSARQYGLFVVSRDAAIGQRLRQSPAPWKATTTKTTKSVSYTRRGETAARQRNVATNAATQRQHRQADLPANIRGGTARQGGVQTRLDVGRRPDQQRVVPAARESVHRHHRLRGGESRPSVRGSGSIHDSHRSRPCEQNGIFRGILRRVHQVVDIRLAAGAERELHAGDERRVGNAISVHGTEDERRLCQCDQR